MLSKKQMAGFVATNILFLLLAVLLIGGSLALLFVDKYPSTDALFYEACTFQKYERISRGKSSDCYHIYVQEYGKPLEIDSIALRAMNRDALEEVKAGDTVIISKGQGKGYQYLYSMSTGDKAILTYEGFLAKHEGNDLVGAVAAGVFSLLPIGLFVANVIHFKKTGRPLPMRVVRVRGVRVRGVKVRIRGKF